MKNMFKIIDNIAHLIGDDNFWATLPPICFISSSSLLMMIVSSLIHRTIGKIKSKYASNTNIKKIEKESTDDDIKITNEITNLMDKTNEEKVKYNYRFNEDRINNNYINMNEIESELQDRKNREYARVKSINNNKNKKHIV